MSLDNSTQNREKLEQVQARLEEIQSRIEIACARAGRDVAEITLIGASKTVPAEKLRFFLEAGLQHCGENYVQEGVAKVTALQAEFPQTQWHLIGALQSNKAREAVANFDWIHGVDRVSLINALDKAAREQSKTQHILLQVNLGGEASKSGCAIEDVEHLAALCREKENLRLSGLMCLPPFNENPEKTRPYFRELRRLRDEVLGDAALHLSAGMSHDFEIAIEEGATMIRVGTALFGEREKAQKES